jgi:hypothetical protein
MGEFEVDEILTFKIQGLFKVVSDSNGVRV